MKRVVTGMLNKQIAYELNLSEITVKIHRGQVMKKMASRNLPDLVRKAEALGMEATRGNSSALLPTAWGAPGENPGVARRI
jgi:orotate phosphoribosyltransferase-like protein